MIHTVLGVILAIIFVLAIVDVLSILGTLGLIFVIVLAAIFIAKWLDRRDNV